jgi:hypothetical protein
MPFLKSKQKSKKNKKTKPTAHCSYRFRILSASVFLPNSHAVNRPFSLRSMPLMSTASCVGAAETREATTTGSVSSTMPSSTISSMMSDTMS